MVVFFLFSTLKTEKLEHVVFKDTVKKLKDCVKKDVRFTESVPKYELTGTWLSKPNLELYSGSPVIIAERYLQLVVCFDAF